MAVEEQKISSIVEQVMARLRDEGALPAGHGPVRGPAIVTNVNKPGTFGVHNDIDGCVQAAQAAHEQLMRLSLEVRANAIQAIRDVAVANAPSLRARPTKKQRWAASRTRLTRTGLQP